MNGRKEVILITGSSGRIGFKSAERFSSKYQIVGFDVYLAGRLPGVDFVAVDIASDESVKEGLSWVKNTYGNKITSVIHLAAFYSFTEARSPNYDRITVQGTGRLIRGLQSFDVEQFIFSSTMLVHAPCKVGERIKEEDPLVGKWAYPESKIKTEELLHRERGQIPVVNLRIAGVYDDRCHSIPLSNQMQRIFENSMEGHLFAGDQTHGASFVHMEDLVDSLWLCVEKRKALPQELSLLIGEPETLSYEELQKLMGRLVYQKDWKTWSVPKPIAKLGAWVQDKTPFIKKSFVKPWMIDLSDDHYCLDITKARKFLGWEPKHKVRDTIPLWVEELRKDPLSWYDENKLKAPSWVKRQGKRCC